MHAHLQSPLVERIAQNASAKLAELEARLAELCGQDNEFGILLAEFQQSFGCNLRPSITLDDQPVTTVRSHTRAGQAAPSQNGQEHVSKKRRRKKRRKDEREFPAGSYIKFAQTLPAYVQKAGSHSKKFTTKDVIALLHADGQKDFKPAWVSLAVAVKMKGIKKVGQTKREGQRSMNLFQLDGKPVALIGSPRK